MNIENNKLLLKTPKEKIEELAKEFEKSPETEQISVVLFVLAGATFLGEGAMKSLALWNATWANRVIDEVGKIKKENDVDKLT